MDGIVGRQTIGALRRAEAESPKEAPTTAPAAARDVTITAAPAAWRSPWLIGLGLALLVVGPFRKTGGPLYRSCPSQKLQNQADLDGAPHVEGNCSPADRLTLQDRPTS